MADVFISYHEKSAGELAAQIAAALETAGISCWYASRDILPGGHFARDIPPQIDACQVFLLILNESVYQSSHIENEVGIAFGRFNREEKITIFPLEIGEFERKGWVRYYLIHTQSIKIPVWNERSQQEVAKKVAYILGKESPQPASAAPATELNPTETRKPEQRKYRQEKTPQRKPQARARWFNNIPPPLLGAIVGLLLLFSSTITDTIQSLIKETYRPSEPKIETKASEDIIDEDTLQSLIQGTAGSSEPEIETKVLEDIIEETWALATDGTLALYNTDTIENYMPSGDSSNQSPWYPYRARITSIEISDEITDIGVWAFRDCPNLTKVTLSGHVTRIGTGAFWSCPKLKEIAIPNSVTDIEDWAFWKTGITAVDVPEKATIGTGAFPHGTTIIRRK